MKLYGKNSVLERIRIDPASIKKLYLRQRTDLSKIVKEAKKAGLDFESVPIKRFSQFPGNAHAQGVIAEVKEFKYTPFSEILKQGLQKKSIPVFLDGVTDPQNLGSIIRSLACLGGFSLVLPEHRAVGVNETVLKVACGGENYVPVATIVNTVRSVAEAKKNGLWIAGAVVEDGKDIFKSDLKFPIAVVIGSEGKGIRSGLRWHLDAKLSLPMSGASLSYNVAVAASLFCCEINRRIENG